MSESIAAARPVAGVPGVVGALDARRKLQLALAAAWLLDGILQYQPSMFSRSFPQMLGDSAQATDAPSASLTVGRQAIPRPSASWMVAKTAFSTAR